MHRLARTMGDAHVSSLTGQTLVLCRIGTQDYALPLDAALRIVPLPALTVIPDSRPEICGWLNLYGRHVPVLDGRRLVGDPPHYDLSSHIVIINGEQDAATPVLGLLVDQVYGLISHLPTAMHPLKRTEAAGNLFCGIIQHDHRSCPVFDVAELRRMAA
ncbi:MAG: chemotaxis protein CheW [Roseiflexus castenholzii]|nr:MAG: chemotaxis protein CheW [Roseiflexus castenholzii]